MVSEEYTREVERYVNEAEKIRRRRSRFLIPLTVLGMVLWLSTALFRDIYNGAAVLGGLMMLGGCLWLLIDFHILGRARDRYEEAYEEEQHQQELQLIREIGNGK